MESGGTMEFCPKCLGRFAFGRFNPTQLHREETSSPNQRVDDFELLEVLGRGGMGIVYRARQVGLDRIVALKMLRDSSLASREQVDRFRAEALAVARLNHPAIVAIHEAGEIRGCPYFVMDYVDGPNLAAVCRGGPVDIQRAVQWMVEASRAVQHAHERGFIHRDLKPSNILIDSNGRIRVTDFGLAKPLDDESMLTVTGQMLGTPAFQAPEQTSSRFGAIGPGTDVYGLSATLYHLLTARPPFVGERISDIFQQVVDAEPLSPRLLNSNVPEGLACICLKGMQKEPSRRYSSAEALATDLGRWRDGKPTCARPVSEAQRLWMWSRRHPRQAASVGTIILLLASIAIVATTMAVRLQRERNQTDAVQKQATDWLARSSLEMARAERLSGIAGFRDRSLAALAIAAQSHAKNEIQRETAATLSLVDVKGVVSNPFPRETSAWMAVDPKYARCAFGTSSGELVLSDLGSGRELCRLKTGRARIWTLAFSPNGRYLAECADDNTFQCWDVDARSRVMQKTLPKINGVEPIAFLPCRDQIALNIGTNSISLYNLNDGSFAGVVQLLRPCRACIFSPDSENLLLRNADQCVVQSVRSGNTLASIDSRTEVTTATWHPGGQQIILGNASGELIRWDWKSGLQERWQGKKQFVASIAFDAKGQLMISSLWNGYSQIWEYQSGQTIVTLDGQFVERFVSEDAQLACITEDDKFGLVEIQRPKNLRRIDTSHIGGRAGAICYSPTGRYMAALGLHGLEVFDSQSLNVIALCPADLRGNCLSFGLNEDFIVAGDLMNVWRWGFNPLADQTHGALPETVDFRNAVSLNSLPEPQTAGPLFPPYRSGGFALFVDLATGCQKYRWPMEIAGPFSLGQGNGSMASNNRGRYVIQRLNGPSTRLQADGKEGIVQFSPNGKLVAHLTRGLLEMNDSWDGGIQWSANLDPGAGGYIAFSPDGRTLGVAGSRSSFIHLYNTTDGTPETPGILDGPDHTDISAIAFDPTSGQLAAAHERQIIVWDLLKLRREIEATLSAGSRMSEQSMSEQRRGGD